MFRGSWAGKKKTRTVIEDEPITVTKKEVMVEVVRPSFVEVGEVGARLF